MYSLEDKILKRVRGRGRGSVFSPKDFYDIEGATAAAVRKSLSRLVDKKQIRRIARGLYDYPKQHPVLGTLSPSPEAIAKALAGRYKLRLMPSGAQATNILHLSEQVPAKVVYLTDGPSRKVTVGNQTIELRHTTPEKMAAAGKVSGLVIEALRYLGQKHVTSEMIHSLRNLLSVKDKQQVKKDIPLAPTWMHNHLRAISTTEKA